MSGYAYTNLCMYAFMYVCICVCLCVCVFVGKNATNIFYERIQEITYTEEIFNKTKEKRNQLTVLFSLRIPLVLNSFFVLFFYSIERRLVFFVWYLFYICV